MKFKISDILISKINYNKYRILKIENNFLSVEPHEFPCGIIYHHVPLDTFIEISKESCKSKNHPLTSIFI